jgi:GGDEF domain-containing protein/CheY-like chemotaxis protein
MTSSTRGADSQADQSETSFVFDHHQDRRYVILADTQPERKAEVFAALRPFDVGVLVANNVPDGFFMLRRFGPPALLIVDLLLPPGNGLDLVDAVRRFGNERSQIVAWAPFREVRELAVTRLAGGNVRILRGGVAPAVLRNVIEQAWSRRWSAPAAAVIVDVIEDRARNLLAAAQQTCRTAGAAVYWRPPGYLPFRTAVAWNSSEPMPSFTHDLPNVFRRVDDTGETLVVPFLPEPGQPGSEAAGAAERDALRGLVAVPIVGGMAEVVGVLCVFDTKPFTFAESEVEALNELGRCALEAHPTPERRKRTSGSLSGPETWSVARRSPATRVLDPGSRMPDPLQIAVQQVVPPDTSIVLFRLDPSSARAGDTAGHDSSAALLTASATLTPMVRDSDFAIRWSAEELLLVLTGATLNDARQVAKRVWPAMQANIKNVAITATVDYLHRHETFESVLARTKARAQLAEGNPPEPLLS